MTSYIPSFLRGKEPDSPMLPLTAQDVQQPSPPELGAPIAIASGSTPRRTTVTGRPNLPSINTGSSRRSAGFRTALPPQPENGNEATTLPQTPSTPATPSRRRAHTISVVMAGRNRAASSVQREASGVGRRRSESFSEGEPVKPRTSGEIQRDNASSPVSSDIIDSDGAVAELDDGAVGVLDCLDPTVATMNHLQNVTNGIFAPHLPQLWSRRPAIVIPESDSEDSLAPLTGEPQTAAMTASTRRRTSTITRKRASTVSKLFPPTSAILGNAPSTPSATFPKSAPAALITSTEEGEETEEDVESIEVHDNELDKHVRHVLKSSKRAKVKQAAKGFWAFVKTPMGFIVAVYGFLCAFWGAGIVLFLVGWIHTSSKYRQDVWVEICSQVENGLFTVTGVGLIPWRVIDTYRMVIIWRLQRRTVTLRKAQGLPPIEDPNDLPDPKDAADYVSVLSDKQQEQLRHQQEAFAKSQTWYKPHATETHTAFPISWALWNTLLMDGNSIFQCMLCGCMWGMDWHERPAWTTGCLIPCSFLCGMGAGILIWQGSVRTKKSAKVEDQLREALGVPLVATGSRHEKLGTGALGDLESGGLKTAPASLSGSNSNRGEKGTGARRRKSSVSFKDTNHKAEDGGGGGIVGGGGVADGRSRTASSGMADLPEAGEGEAEEIESSGHEDEKSGGLKDA
ncbi:hypothetical protein BCR39DRAFT_515962 [Naematelia encephala]|uniref:Uncharacterized protein n=1 Tax=Naematelia encephala TaxID=71784 RepID=A0A1Y2BJN8_9TREE|nr:hypothetical protein BCR39DRAFT_515962 [Naematelia encephala]